MHSLINSIVLWGIRFLCPVFVLCKLDATLETKLLATPIDNNANRSPSVRRLRRSIYILIPWAAINLVIVSHVRVQKKKERKKTEREQRVCLWIPGLRVLKRARKKEKKEKNKEASSYFGTSCARCATFLRFVDTSKKIKINGTLKVRAY